MTNHDSNRHFVIVEGSRAAVALTAANKAVAHNASGLQLVLDGGTLRHANNKSMLHLFVFLAYCNTHSKQSINPLLSLHSSTLNRTRGFLASLLKSHFLKRHRSRLLHQSR